ncbi:MAG: SRPBCC family protein [Candidatus Didemnitutus sp.]|nr:SRPBCC family protein [Candidatus Didemnitutus sp.]
MQVRTFSLTVLAPRDTVFNYLADIENLPRWAADFCERLEVFRGRWLALTAQGDLFLEMEADEHTGVIDLHAGDEHQRVRLLPLRVLDLPGGGTLVNCVFYQSPDQTGAAYERQCNLLSSELGRLAGRFGGGELHEPVALPQLATVGAN